MPARICSYHSTATAVFRCEGCGRLLCSDCVDQGHRLLFCRHCGEQALPLESHTPATVPELRRASIMTQPYSFGDALAYPFRGFGGYVFWGYLLILTAFGVLEALPGFGCGVLMLRLAVYLLLPGLLYRIVRTTAEGGTELPDWPDFGDFVERIKEWLVFLLIHIIALLPLVLVFWIAGFGVVEILSASPWTFVALLAISLWLVLAIWVPALGSTGTYDSPWLSFRIDLHLRALAVGGADSVKIISLLYALVLGSQLLRAVAVMALPLVGTVAAIALGIYALFTGAHLTGLLFRRHATSLEKLYVG